MGAAWSSTPTTPKGPSGYWRSADGARGFALSILLILVLSLAFNYFPPLGYVSFFEDPLRNLQIMILPAAILGVSISATPLLSRSKT